MIILPLDLSLMEPHRSQILIKISMMLIVRINLGANRDLPLIGTHRPQIVIKILMVLDLKVNLGFIPPFPVDYSYLQVHLKMFSDEKYEKILFLIILPPDLAVSTPKVFKRHFPCLIAG